MTPQQGFELATTLHRAGRLAEAGRLYDALVAAFPDQAELRRLRGLARFGQGERTGAGADWRRAVALAPDHGLAWLGLGDLAGDPAAYRRATRADPTLLEAWEGLSLAAHRDRPDEADAANRRALALAPGHAPAIAHRAEAAGGAGWARRAARLAPGRPASWRAVALAARRAGRTAEAASALAAALALDPADAIGWNNRGGVALDRHDEPAARACFRRALWLDPDNGNARFLLAALSGATPATAPSDYVAGLFDEYADRFDGHLVARLGYRVPQDMAALWRARCGADWRGDILDVGCGTGAAGPLFRPWARRLVGIDLAPRMVARARATGAYDDVVRIDALGFLADHGASFDLIIAADLLIYLGDPMPLLAAAAGALRPGGQALLSVERRDDGVLFGLEPAGRYSHDPRALAAAAADAGLATLADLPITVRLDRDRPVSGALLLLGLPPFPAAS